MPIDPEAILPTLSLEQKVALLSGHDSWHTVAVPGVPSLRCSDGPAGVRGSSWSGPPSASFPCATALGATFDPELIEEIGQALGREARSKNAQLLLAPTVNLHRTPIGGRNFECMSEDPTLTAHLAVAYVKGVQSERVACCIKHFIANDTEFERMTISSDVDERTLRELYLAPFEAAVRPTDEGGADVRAVMSSYNKINGTYAAENEWLLRTVLRDEWGFTGAVVSDWYGTHDAVGSLEAGLDLEMPGPPRIRGQHLLDAVRAGDVSEARVDEAVRHLLDLLAWTGLGDDDAGWSTDEVTDDRAETRDVIRRAAIAGTVLLTNRRLDDGAAVLPIGPTARIALIGPNSDRGEIQGGGSARVRPSKPVRPLAALRARGLDVRHHAGCSISKRLPPVRGRFEATYEAADGTTVVVPLERLSMIYVDPPAAGIPITEFGVTVRGTFVPDSSGEWVFGMSIVGSGVLSVNGETVVDLTIPQTGGGFFGMGSPEIRGTVELEAGTPAEIEFRYPVQHFGMLRGITIGAGPLHEPDGVSDAALIAADADVAVVVVGTTEEWETEGEDRTTMRLPGRQDELIRAVAAANPATVVVINAGSPVEMPWVDEVAAVLQVWFPGEEMGNALADVLLGVAEPGGRLPITIPVRLEDTPAYLSHPGQHGHAPYAEGLFIGYRWYDARHLAPRFPFGHGLGYTTWEMGPSTVAGSIDDGVTVTTSVTNTGSRAGSTVVQVYVEPPADGPRRPLRELRGFAKVSLEPGETIDAQVWLPERAFSTWHPVERRWWVPGGAYHLHVGESSRSLDVAGSVIAETP